ncbi:MAG: DUF4926 domain-containing protein [Armatimonadetes bacterium]|nr:DUF4926 domain-containing protein [Armatimonadota bacterium]
MLLEHDRVVLTAPIESDGLMPGDVGTIVHVYRHAMAYEVEFLMLDGTTVCVATVPPTSMRPITSRDLTHARPLEYVGT